MDCRFLRINKQRTEYKAKWQREHPDEYAALVARSIEQARANPIRKRARMLYSTYRMTVEQFDAMVQAQNGLCAICGFAPVGRGKTDFLVVDHCHDSGKVRSLLCGKCNSALGLLDENPDILRSMLRYIKKWT